MAKRKFELCELEGVTSSKRFYLCTVFLTKEEAKNLLIKLNKSVL